MKKSKTNKKKIIIKNQNDINKLELILSRTNNNSDLIIICKNNDLSYDDLSAQIYHILLKNRNIAQFNLLRLDIDINPISMAQIYEQFKIKRLELPRANIKDLEAICYYLNEDFPGVDPNFTCAPSEVEKLNQTQEKIAQ